MISVFGTEIAAAQMRKLAKTTRCCSIVVAEIKLKMKKGIWSYLTLLETELSRTPITRN